MKNSPILYAGRCAACGEVTVLPTEACRKCGAAGLTSEAMSGRGAVYSFTTVQAPPLGFENDAPYVVALIRLEEGLLVAGRVDGADALEIGQAVVFSGEDNRGLHFRLAG